jgi:Dolichyl-phosphate-mannose-protein mannosyltransferase
MDAYIRPRPDAFPVARWRSLGQITAGRGEAFVNRGRTAVRLIFVAAGACAAYAVALYFTGGFESELFGTRIRSRGWERPAYLSLALLTVAAGLFLRRSASAPVIWGHLDSVHAGRALAAVGIVWALVAGVRFGTFSAGGSDSFGYISQAHLFSRADLTDQVPMRAEFTWRDAELSLIPLAYRPAAQPGRMAPVPPPGLPLILAAVRPLGERAMYLVIPVFGALAVFCTLAIGRRLGDPLAGGIAALLLSVSATFLLLHFAPMSDVPVTALWLAALVMAHARTKFAPLLAGVLTGAAVLTRPNLAPLAAVIAALIAVENTARIRNAAMFLAPVTAAVAALLWIQSQRYGGALQSGYGPAEELFALAYVGPNLLSYAGRVTSVFSLVIWLWLASPILLWRRSPPPLLLACLAIVVGTWIAYLVYLPFEPWFFTRFLLPAIPIMLVLAVMVVLVAIRRLPFWMRPVAVAVFVAVMLAALAGQSRRLGVFDSKSIEQKYPEAGAYVRQQLPASAYVLARQHSGSVRLYGERPTIRWDVIGGDQLDLVVATLRSIGATVYVVADDDEMPEFVTHFDRQITTRKLSPLAQFGQARVYAVE